MDTFNEAKEGECSVPGSMEAGSMFKQTINKAAEALKTFLSRFDINYALSLESGGVFVRTPFDEKLNNEFTTDIDNVLTLMGGVYGRNHPNINNSTAMCNDKQTGTIRGATIGPGKYSGSFLDYAMVKHNIPAVAAHVSCCLYPKHKDIIKLYQDNLLPLRKFLSLSFQGVWGRVTDHKGKALANVAVNIGGLLRTTDQQGKYIAVYPTGEYKLEVTHEGFKPMNARFKVEADTMSRKDVMLDPIALALDYNGYDAIKASLVSLVNQYPNYAEMYNHDKMVCIKISDDIMGDMRPVVSVVGWSNIGEEVSLNLAQYLVTRIGKDDTVSEITSKFEVHILLSKSLPANINNSTATHNKCPSSAHSHNSGLEADIRSWSATRRDLFRLNLVSGDARVTGSGQGAMLATEYSGQLVGDSGQCADNDTHPDNSGSRGPEDSMTVGLSCCLSPPNLGTVWVAHSRPLLSALNSLHGVHAMLVDNTGNTLHNTKPKVTLNNTQWTPDLSSGHFWRLLAVGQHEVKVGEVTKLVNIVPGRMEIVKFEMPTGLSSSMILFLFAAIGAFLLVLFFYRQKRFVVLLTQIPYQTNLFFRRGSRRNSKKYGGSRDGFQKLNDKDDYTDSDEENIEFDK